jgi:hypothetical protein
MRHTFTSHESLAQEWIRQTNTHGKTKSMNFSSDTIYSYGYHFPIACFTEEGPVLFTTRGYSSSTAKHKHAVERVLRSAGIAFIRVDNVRAQSAQDHADNLEDLRSRIIATHKKMIRSRKNKQSLAIQVKDLINNHNAYVDSFLPGTAHWGEADIDGDVLVAILSGDLY